MRMKFTSFLGKLPHTYLCGGAEKGVDSENGI